MLSYGDAGITFREDWASDLQHLRGWKALVLEHHQILYEAVANI
jgi:hypothetical protein